MATPTGLTMITSISRRILREEATDVYYLGSPLTWRLFKHEQGGPSWWSAHRVPVRLPAVGDRRGVLRPRGTERRAVRHRDLGRLGLEGVLHQRHLGPAFADPGRLGVRRGQLRRRAVRDSPRWTCATRSPTGSGRTGPTTRRSTACSTIVDNRGHTPHLRRPDPDRVPVPEGPAQHNDDNAVHRRS